MLGPSTEELRAIVDSKQPGWETARTLLDQEGLKERLLAEAIETGDWDQALMITGSEERAAVLVQALEASDDEAAREMLRDTFNICDALHNELPALRAQFERVGFITDLDIGAEGDLPELPVTVYRAQWGKDPEPVDALSWTTDREVAERFARGLTGPRARFILGIYREDDEPWIWQATCTKMLAYFNSRDEKEVVPAELSFIAPIARLVSVPPE